MEIDKIVIAYIVAAISEFAEIHHLSVDRYAGSDDRRGGSGTSFSRGSAPFCAGSQRKYRIEKFYHGLPASFFLPGTGCLSLRKKN